MIVRAKLTRLGAATAATVLAVLCGNTVATAADGNIDSNASGSITVHKFAQPESTPAGTANGEPLAPDVVSSLDPLAGVTFTVQKVNSCTLDGTNVSFDVNVAEDANFWSAVNGLTAADLLDADCDLALVGEGQTAVDGSANFPNLDLGLYLVSETDSGEHVIVKKVAPFLVTLPMIGSADNWNYDVHAYPKNSVATATKTVDDSSAYFFGDTVTWETVTTIPYLGTAPVPAISISESFNQEELQYAGTNPYVLTADKDITLVVDEDYTCEELATGVTCQLTAAGRGKVGGGVTLTLTTATEVLSGSAITSTSTVTMEDSSITASATTNWGSLTVLNHLAGNETVTLAGAVIKLYSADPSEGDLAPLKTYTSGADGTSPNAAGIRAGTAFYIQAATPPAGHVANSTVFSAQTTVGVSTTVKISYAKVNTNSMLPALGETGALIFPLLGLAVIGVSVGAVLLHNRRLRERDTTS